MFITHPEFEGFLPKFAGYEHCKRWEIFELAADLPYYMVELLQAAETREAHHLSLIVANAHLVEQMLKKSDKSSKVLRLHMVRPSSYNGTDSWTTQKIVRIWRGDVKQLGHRYPVLLFDLQGVGIVVEPPIEDSSPVRKKELLYEFVPSPETGYEATSKI